MIEQINLKVNSDFKKQCIKYAASRQLSLSSLIKMLLQQEIDKQK